MELTKDRSTSPPHAEKGEYGVILLLALLAVGLVLLGSDTTSPFFLTKPYRIVSADPPTFILIGRYWLTEGCVPYKEIFDQKGPIPFLLNGLGWRICDSAWGICVIQAFSLFTYLSLAYRSCRVNFDRFRALGVTVFSFAVLCLLYGEGDTVEEYNLPVMMLCFAGFLRYSRRRAADTDAVHDPRWAFVYGAGAAFFLLSRPSDAGPVGIGVLVLGADLLVRGKTRSFLRNIAMGLLGVFSLLLPFVLYFLLHDALADFWYGTIGFNLTYATKDTAFWLNELTWKSGVKLVFYCLPILAALAVGLLALFRGQGMRAALWAGIAAYALLFYCLSRGYRHYLISFVPLTVPALCELADLLPPKDKKQIRARDGFFAAALAAVVLVGLVQGRRYFSDSLFFWRNRDALPCEELAAEIPKDERGEVLFLNCLSSLYLSCDIRPCARYFAFQDWQGSFSPSMMVRITAELAEGKAKWILSQNRASPPLQEILDSQYTVYDTRDGFTLYERIAKPG